MSDEVQQERVGELGNDGRARCLGLGCGNVSRPTDSVGQPGTNTSHTVALDLVSGETRQPEVPAGHQLRVDPPLPLADSDVLCGEGSRLGAGSSCLLPTREVVAVHEGQFLEEEFDP